MIMMMMMMMRVLRIFNIPECVLCEQIMKVPEVTWAIFHLLNAAVHGLDSFSIFAWSNQDAILDMHVLK